MRINHNISALKANNQLSRTNLKLDKSLERLSSGYRINSAADDAAGLAISEKMRTQIAGLDQASRNASDGISVIQTAEGALVEVEAMLQRMRELAVQAANGTYTADDRASIQAEINQLNNEIQRISDTTEFNTMTLLDGNIDRKSFSNNDKVKLISQSDSVNVGDYQLEITQDPRQAVLIGDVTAFPATGTIGASQTGTITVNGESVEINEFDTIDEVMAKLTALCDMVDVNVFAIDDTAVPSTTDNLDTAGYASKEFASGDRLIFVSKDYGSREKIEVHCDNANLASIFGLRTTVETAVGYDAKVELVRKAAIDPTSLYENTATKSIRGDKITVEDKGGFKMVIEVAPGTVGNTFDDRYMGDTPADVTDPGSGLELITISVLSAGPMDLQIGANEGQTMSVRIPKVTPKTLGIDKVNICTQDGAEEAITLLDNAVNEVSAIRAKLGAYQNRLEHSIANLDVTSENMTESLSRIEDVDMAEEMANYTQKNVLAQAGTAMLSQANQRPQMILSLLQQ